MYQRNMRKYYNKSKPYSRQIYKATGLVNPIKRGKVSFTRVMKDVKMLKDAINSEKLRITDSFSLAQVGQVNVNAEGFFVKEFTPAPAQGDTTNGRTGASVKLSGSYVQLQFIQQSNTSAGPVSGKIMIFRCDSPSIYVSPTNVVHRRIQTNPFITPSIRDYNSPEDIDAFKSFPKVFEKRFKLSADQTSSGAMIRTINFGLKYKDHHVKWDNNSTDWESGRLIMVIFLDAGNTNSTTSSTSVGVPISTPNSGYFLNGNITHYYHDN